MLVRVSMCLPVMRQQFHHGELGQRVRVDSPAAIVLNRLGDQFAPAMPLPQAVQASLAAYPAAPARAASPEQAAPRRQASPALLALPAA